MNEMTICAVGNVATQPVYRELAAGPSARFRLAVTSRYWDREKSTWVHPTPGELPSTSGNAPT